MPSLSGTKGIFSGDHQFSGLLILSHPLLTFTSANLDTSREWQIFSLPISARPPYGVIISQTCDICEPRPNNPFINIAPIVDLS